MSAPAFYIVRATAYVASGQVTVWVGRRTPAGPHVWRWEVLRVLWQSMGTAETARWVAREYHQAYPEAAAEIEPRALAAAVAQALAVVEPLYQPGA
ncbi:hypothetical protein [Hymenobacter koreensis]|uniref:PqqD family protein n=1 Tax=Hymenobacter koreensis TaxID=1084523 RepID=A0ABP8JDR8_9BACT